MSRVNEVLRVEVENEIKRNENFDVNLNLLINIISSRQMLIFNDVKNINDISVLKRLFKYYTCVTFYWINEGSQKNNCIKNEILETII